MKAKIYFDKNTDNAKSFEFDSFNESVASNSLGLTVRYAIESEEDIPDFKTISGLSFTTMTIEDKDGNAVPYFGTYSKVDDVMANYYEADNIYTVNVSVK